MTTIGRGIVAFVVRWLALLILLLIPAAPTPEPIPGKGLAGKATAAQMTEQGATWWHHWRPCREGEAATGCVDHVKAEWTLYEGSSFYGDLDNMRERLALCESGWFMFGDEYRIQGWELDDQVDELAWFVAERDAANPDCKIVFGGIEPWHPRTGDNVDWVALFADAYQDRFGVLPPVDAVMIDAYDWPGWNKDTFPAVDRMIVEIHRVYGDDIEVWAREIGCLLSNKCAMGAMRNMWKVTQGLDRWAWFMTADTGEGWEYTTLYDSSGDLTELGAGYRDWQPPKTYRVFLPRMER